MSIKTFELLNKCSAEVLVILFEQFPTEKSLNIGDFRYLNTEETASVFSSSMRFLHREGLIEFSSASKGTFKGVALSRKGRWLLSSSTTSLNQNISYVRKISSALQEGRKQTINAVIGELVRHGASFAD